VVPPRIGKAGGLKGPIREVLGNINTLRADVAYPLLLEMYDDFANERLPREDFIGSSNPLGSTLVVLAFAGKK
jgi:hypothetical protein